MSKRAGIRIRKLGFLIALMVSIGASAETLTGTVVGVADGDTITVLDANREQHKIRLGGIDAPEKAQPFGQRSKESLSAMVFGKEADLTSWRARRSDLSVQPWALHHRALTLRRPCAPRPANQLEGGWRDRTPHRSLASAGSRTEPTRA